MADIVYLWDVPDEEWPAFCGHGCGDVSLAEYRARVDAARQEAETAGAKVLVVRATVAEVLAKIAELGLRNNPQGRAGAIGAIAMESC